MRRQSKVMAWAIGAGVAIGTLGIPALPASAEVQAATVEIDGMSCSFCAVSLQKRLDKLPGVEKAKVLFDEGRAELAFDGTGRIDLEHLREEVRNGGYTARKVDLVVRGRLVEGEEGDWILLASSTGQSFRLAEGEGLSAARAQSRDGERTVQIKGNLDEVKGVAVLHIGSASAVPAADSGPAQTGKSGRAKAPR